MARDLSRHAVVRSLWGRDNHGSFRTFGHNSIASVRGTDRREGKLTAKSDGGSLVVTETSGCRRTARLSRG